MSAVSNFNPMPRPDGTERFQAERLSFRLFKRGIDLVGSVAGLALLGPVMAACAAWVLLRDGRPVLYRQWRVGRRGWLFCIYKLRTMRRDAESCGARFAEASDARVIPGCAWMRRSHVDELPQLWNILLGEMSLVGPRPERPEMHVQLRRSVPGLDWRLAASPGLTGLAQVRCGYANDLKGARQKLAMDLRYLRRRSVWRELRLLAATAPKFWDRAAL